MSDIDQLKNLLFLTFKGSSNEEIKKAEQELQKAASHPEFLQYLLQIMKDKSIEDNIRVSASTYVQTFVRKAAQPNFNQETQKKVIEQIVLMIKDDDVSVNQKQNIAKGLSIALCFDKDNSMKLKLLELIHNWFMSDSTNVKLTATLIILQIVIVSTTNKDFLLNFFKILNVSFCQIGSKYLGEVSSALQSITTLQEAEAEQAFNSTIEQLKVLNIWAIALKDLIYSIMDSKKVALVQIILENQVLANLICHGICVSLSTPQQIPDCLICTSGKEKFDLEANLLKSVLLKSYNKVNKLIFHERSKYEVQKTHFFKLLVQTLPIVLKGLILFCEQAPNFQDQLEVPSLAAIVIECLKFSTVCAEQSEFYSTFQECSRILLLEVIFPLMRTSKAEEESLQTDPEEFVKLALDTCDKQQIYSYKTAAAKLLETVCDFIDGFETIVCLLILQIISFSIQYDTIDQIDTSYQSLAQFKHTIFISKTDRLSRIDTCLVSLTVLNYLTPKRPDIVGQIESLIRHNSTFFFSPQLNKVLKSRVCLMVGSYTDSIFQDDQNSFDQLLTFLFSCIQLKEEEDQGIVYQSIDSLLSIYDDENQAKLVSASVNSAYQLMLPLIMTSKFHQFFDIILQIIKNHSSRISKENIFTSVGCLVSRVIEEVREFLDWLVMIDYFSREISENKNLVPQYINGILEQLKPLLQCLQYPEKIEFDEDIILLVGSFVKNQQDVHPICGDLILCFPLIFKKQNGVFGQIFDTFNNVIIYGKNFLLNNPTHLKLIIEMAYKAMFGDHSRSYDSDKAEGATILQLIFQSLGDSLEEEYWKAIFQTAIQRIQSNQQLRHQFVYGRTAGIFLSAFVSNLPKAQQILSEMGILDKVIDLVLERIDNYKRGYDIKLFIMSMSMVMINVTLEPQRVLKIFDCLVCLMMKQKEMEIKITNKKNKPIDQGDNSDDDNEDSDDYDDDEEDEEDEELEGEEYDPNNPNNYDRDDCSVSSDKIMMKHLNSPISARDEFSSFKHSYLTMKTQNINALQELIHNLNSEKQNYLREILSVQRINFGDSQVLRVIRTVKRKQQN